MGESPLPGTTLRPKKVSLVDPMNQNAICPPSRGGGNTEASRGTRAAGLQLARDQADVPISLQNSPAAFDHEWLALAERRWERSGNRPAFFFTVKQSQRRASLACPVGTKVSPEHSPAEPIQTKEKIMNAKTLILSTVVLGLMSTVAMAEDATATGMVGGAATGAIVGGPVGAGVGAVVGAVAGAALDPPPQEVITYVQEQPLPQSVLVEQQVVVGKALPREVVLMPVAEDPRYAYTVVNDQRLIVDPKTYTVVQVLQ
jgi:hypothetical protein